MAHAEDGSDSSVEDCEDVGDGIDVDVEYADDAQDSERDEFFQDEAKCAEDKDREINDALRALEKFQV